MLVLISWRNIWRNRSRSLVVIGSLVVGIWALIFMVGFTNSFIISYINGAIKNEISHLQIHHPEFKTDYNIKYVVPGGEELADSILSNQKVKAVSPRTIINGMVSSARKALGIRIYGVDPALEREVTHHDSLIVEGAYFEGIKRNPMVISKTLAEDLGIKLKYKLILTFQDVNQEITAGAFRVAGIIDTSSPTLNKSSVFVNRSDLNRIANIPNGVHEIAIFLNTPDDEETILSSLSMNLPGLLVESWRTIAPELELFLDMMDSFLWVLLGIIMIALAFGIINSMLMAVLERFKELGMLMAVGMNKIRVFSMIVMETLFLCVIGGPLGLLAGYFTIELFAKTGIDLSQYSAGLKEWGYDSILYPFVEPSVYFQIALGAALTAFIAALYPAYSAIKLNPTEALRKI